ncbi:MAG: outer membrane protein transport protein [Pseudomonadota bacterium]
MNKLMLTAAATLLGTTSAFAVGLDRSAQDISIIFEEGDYAELSFGYVDPSLDGEDLAVFGGQSSGNVADSFVQGSLGYKQQINDQLSFAIILDQPYGADIDYPTGTLGGDGSLALGGTEAVLNSTALTALMRYEFGNGFSVHGGVRGQEVNGRVRLEGAAYGALSGYEVELDGDLEFGWQAGFAYERPDIALRVAVTYFSEIEFDFDSVETLGGAPLGPADTTETTTPQAVNLTFQTGVAPGTLVFGSIRWADYDDSTVSPPTFDLLVDPAISGSSLTSLETGFSYTLGVGRQFTDRFSGLVELQFDEKGDDDLVSPLAPTNGSVGITIGGRYAVNENVTVTGGINYTKLGDAFAETGTPDTERAEFEDNDAIGVGIQVGYRF